MSQSLSKIYVHLIFSTKHRLPMIDQAVQPKLHAYLAGIFSQLECAAVNIGGVSDHVHVLFRLSKVRALCDVVEEIKKGSSKWMKTQGESYAEFYWQSGDGAFSVSVSNVDAVRNYIRNQSDHHKTVSFQDELRAFLRKHEIEFDERYVWD